MDSVGEGVSCRSKPISLVSQVGLLCPWVIFWEQGLVGSDSTIVRKRAKSIFTNSLAHLLRKAFKQVHQSMEIKV